MSVEATVGPRGKISLPVTLRKKAGIDEGDPVFLRVEKPGVIVIETRAALRRRIRSGCPSGGLRDTDRPE